MFSFQGIILNFPVFLESKGRVCYPLNVAFLNPRKMLPRPGHRRLRHCRMGNRRGSSLLWKRRHATPRHAMKRHDRCNLEFKECSRNRWCCQLSTLPEKKDSNSRELPSPQSRLGVPARQALFFTHEREKKSNALGSTPISATPTS